MDNFLLVAGLGACAVGEYPLTNQPGSAPIPELRAAMLQLIANGYPKLSVVAKRIGITPRTLQRRLNAARTSYTELANELRFELAKKLLQDPHMKISNVATELGFKNHSGFCRAFRSWSGMTALAYRAQLQDTGAQGRSPSAKAPITVSSAPRW